MVIVDHIGWPVVVAASTVLFFLGTLSGAIIRMLVWSEARIEKIASRVVELTIPKVLTAVKTETDGAVANLYSQLVNHIKDNRDAFQRLHDRVDANADSIKDLYRLRAEH